MMHIQAIRTGNVIRYCRFATSNLNCKIPVNTTGGSIVSGLRGANKLGIDGELPRVGLVGGAVGAPRRLTGSPTDISQRTLSKSSQLLVTIVTLPSLLWSDVQRILSGKENNLEEFTGVRPDTADKGKN